MDLVSPYKGNQPYIFISYSHRNSAEVTKVISKLNQLEFRVWYDGGIEPGTEWDENIASHVSECAYFIAFISDEYLESSNCKDELNFARDKNKPILLVYLKDTKLPEGMSMRLNRIQAIHKYACARELDFYQKVVETDGINICRDLSNGRQAVADNEPAREISGTYQSAVSVPQKGKGKIGLIVGISAAVLAVGAICFIAVGSAGKNNEDDYIYTSAAVDETPTETSATAIYETTTSEEIISTETETPETTAESGVVWVTKQPYNDGYYTGEWENNHPVGFGTIMFENSDDDGCESYTGNWVNGKANGEMMYFSTSDDGEKYYEPLVYDMGKHVVLDEGNFFRMYDSDDVGISGFRLIATGGTFDDEGTLVDGISYDLMPKVPSYTCKGYKDGEITNEVKLLDSGNSFSYEGGYYVGESENGVPNDYGSISYNGDDGWYYGYLGNFVNGEPGNMTAYFSVSEDFGDYKENSFQFGDVEFGVGLNGIGIRLSSFSDGLFTVLDGLDGKFVDGNFTDGKALYLDENGLPFAYRVYKNGEVTEEYEF
ncbi:MAG: toll/interleukin-1 receptor domain-containing protein [Eubacterium sp.]|nr:toll/interleukin-1 receptor domain-containing protein [Eubacterium sp.]